MDRWIGRILWLLVGVTLSLPALWLAVCVTGSLAKGYRWREMDWNNDGHTSVGEFLETIDTLEQQAIIGGHRCTQIIAMKDAMVLRTICPMH